MFNDGSQQHNDAGTPRVIVSAHIDSPYSRVTKNFDKMVVAIGSLSTLPLTDDPWFHLSDHAVQTTRHSRQDVVGVEASKPALDTIERLVLLRTAIVLLPSFEILFIYPLHPLTIQIPVLPLMLLVQLVRLVQEEVC